MSDATLPAAAKSSILVADPHTRRRNAAEARFRAYCDEVVREQSRLRRSSGTVAYGGL